MTGGVGQAGQGKGTGDTRKWGRTPETLTRRVSHSLGQECPPCLPLRRNYSQASGNLQGSVWLDFVSHYDGSHPGLSVIRACFPLLITSVSHELPGRNTPRGNPACRGTFGGRRKAVRDRLAPWVSGLVSRGSKGLCRALAPRLLHTGLVARQHTDSSWTRD